MGRIRTTTVKRTAMDLLQQYPDRFSGDFEQNKKVVSELLQVSKKERNRIAGYITSLWKRQNAAENRPGEV
jgi:small subunit ribosomal protein S17e